MTIYGVYETFQYIDYRAGKEDSYDNRLIELCSNKEVAYEIIRNLIKNRITRLKKDGHSQKEINLAEKNLIEIQYDNYEKWSECETLFHVRNVSVVTEI